MMRCWWVVTNVVVARRVVPVWEKPTNSTRRVLMSNAAAPQPKARLSPEGTSHEVRSLPGLPGDWRGTHYAGMLGSDDATGGRLFYWFFEREGGGVGAPLLVWLNGGPGCTSMDGLFLENGPFRLRESSRSLDRRRSSWHTVANTLYVDQPVGTGFSWTASGAYCRNDACIARHFVTFLGRFARLYASLVLASPARSVPIYFSGESHAGHYVPLLVDALVEDDDGIEWNVRGMALGNAWIDPYNQYDASRMGFALGLISADASRTLRSQEKTCQVALDRKQYMSKACWNLLDDVVRTSGSKNRDHLKANMYDAREAVRSTAQFPPGHERVEAYMNTPAVREALHVDPSAPKFYECANPPYNALKHQDGLGIMPVLRKLLDRGEIQVLFYNGQFDLICNHVGVQRSLLALDWARAENFRRAPYVPWMRRGGLRPAGHFMEVPGLALLVVADAGHMVPMNQPEVALDMITNFITAIERGDSLAAYFTSPQYNATRHPINGACVDTCGTFRTPQPALHKTNATPLSPSRLSFHEGSRHISGPNRGGTHGSSVRHPVDRRGAHKPGTRRRPIAAPVSS
ncbi:hypothetical protein CTAYLR_006571 [Chrysophaeum taylorii]|uniref:Serine carboxypeptidase n=1 Tax=Chrysophaeum taylorii TaxID=2483200 RepID=A0AAD7XIN9_9STRA|nr:hypothetical protein CTAYLR_008502 [Chrysophaeum taylorii]KAJ8604704.1 hypothetical protein CTAYLR_006571 [Chrysophaeum taylorii]